MQKVVQECIDKYGIGTDIHTRYMDLLSEIGEMGKEIVKSTNYGKRDFVMNDRIMDEIGDCLFSLLAMCNELNIDAQDALLQSISKYERRFEANGTISSEKI